MAERVVYENIVGERWRSVWCGFFFWELKMRADRLEARGFYTLGFATQSSGSL
jgi:hypothetical protein